MTNKKYRKVKPYSELSDNGERRWKSEKEEREDDRRRIKKLDDYDETYRKKMYIFDVYFKCPECNQQTKGQIAINRNSPIQTSDTFGFVTHHWLMCNKCYYGI